LKDYQRIQFWTISFHETTYVKIKPAQGFSWFCKTGLWF